MKDKPFIGIAGNIGVGKTTFTSFVAKKFNLVDTAGYERIGTNYNKEIIAQIDYATTHADALGTLYSSTITEK